MTDRRLKVTPTWLIALAALIMLAQGTASVTPLSLLSVLAERDDVTA